MLENNQAQCYVIVNDTKDKSKLSMAAFILKPLEIIKFMARKPKSIIWSDGPSSELENKCICNFLFLLSETQKCFSGFEWEYLATSHGKKVVDGIGGTALSPEYMQKQRQEDQEYRMQLTLLLIK